MMGVEIVDNCVIGAQSCVSKSIHSKGVYAGSPARFIKDIVTPSIEEKISKTKAIINEYRNIAEYHDLSPRIVIDYPWVIVNDFKVNFETFEFDGTESVETDDFRDYIRKWGIRIYTKRPFLSHFSYD